MSYILDALRRSEEERNRGNVPTLETVYYDQDDRGLDFLHSTTGRILVLALLLALAALLYSNRGPLVSVVDRLFGGEQQAVAETRPAVAPSAVQQQDAAQPVQTPAPAGVQQQVAVQPVQTTAPAGVQQQVAVQPVQTATPAVMQAESQPVQPVPAQPLPAAQPQTLQQPVVTEPVISAPAQTAPVNAANNQVALATPPASTETSQATSSRDVKTKHDLPPEVMRSVPKLALSVVSYAADPKKRFVMVDSEMYYEGEEITENLIIESITADGPIVSWRGHEFLIQP